MQNAYKSELAIDYVSSIDWVRFAEMTFDVLLRLVVVTRIRLIRLTRFLLSSGELDCPFTASLKKKL